MHVCHLLNIANTEVESNVLNSTIEVESNHLWLLVDKVRYLLLGANNLIPCETLTPRLKLALHKALLLGMVFILWSEWSLNQISY